MNTNIKFMIVFNKLVYQFSQKVEKNLSELGMPASIYPILAHLNQVTTCKTQELGKVAAITSGSITYMVKKLEQNKWIIREQDTFDRRVTWITITKLGKHAFDQVNAVHLNYLNDLLSTFSESEKLQMIEQMKYFGIELEKKED